MIAHALLHFLRTCGPFCSCSPILQCYEFMLINSSCQVSHHGFMWYIHIALNHKSYKFIQIHISIYDSVMATHCFMIHRIRTFFSMAPRGALVMTVAGVTKRPVRSKGDTSGHRPQGPPSKVPCGASSLLGAPTEFNLKLLTGVYLGYWEPTEFNMWTHDCFNVNSVSSQSRLTNESPEASLGGTRAW